MEAGDVTTAEQARILVQHKLLYFRWHTSAASACYLDMLEGAVPAGPVALSVSRHSVAAYQPVGSEHDQHPSADLRQLLVEQLPDWRHRR